MSSGLRVRRLDRNAWQELVVGFADHNYRQSWDYSVAAASRIGAQNESLAILVDDEIRGLANVRVKSLPFVRAGVAYLSGAPLVRRKGSTIPYARALGDCLRALKQEYANQRSYILRVVYPPAIEAVVREQEQVLLQQGYRATEEAQRYRTLVLDLAKSEEELRKDLAQKWRNCLNSAEKNPLEVRRGSTDELFETFQSLFDELRERKWFDVDMGPAFFREVRREQPEDEAFVVHIAEANGIPVAGHVGAFLGETAVYLLGASTRAGNDLKASYLLQWNALLHARALGCREYDLGGIDPEENPGVYRFKQRMGGHERLGALPSEIRPGLTGRGILLAEQAYRRFSRR